MAVAVAACAGLPGAAECREANREKLCQQARRSNSEAEAGAARQQQRCLFTRKPPQQPLLMPSRPLGQRESKDGISRVRTLSH